MDRLEAMAVFVKVADLAGFAPAARALKLHPSAVTRLVAGLEDHLGARLLQRTTRAVTLTDAGERYLARARRILADVADAEDAAQAERKVPSGRFVVASPNAFGRLHVAPLMCEYLAAYPKVVGELTLSDRLVNMVDEGVDCAVRIGHLADSTLVARVVGETRRVVVGAPSYLAKHAAPRSPSDLRAHALVHFTALARAPEWTFKGGASVPLAPRFVTNSVDAALGHVKLGGGLTMALSYQVAELIRAGHLVEVLRDHAPDPVPIQIVYPTTRHLSAKVRAFVDRAAKRDWRFTTLGLSVG